MEPDLEGDDSCIECGALLLWDEEVLCDECRFWEQPDEEDSPMPDPLFDLALESKREELRCRGAVYAGIAGPGRWRLPDGRILSEEEALAWLRNTQDRSGEEPT